MSIINNTKNVLKKTARNVKKTAHNNLRVVQKKVAEIHEDYSYEKYKKSKEDDRRDARNSCKQAIKEGCDYIKTVSNEESVKEKIDPINDMIKKLKDHVQTNSPEDIIEVCTKLEEELEDHVNSGELKVNSGDTAQDLRDNRNINSVVERTKKIFVKVKTQMEKQHQKEMPRN